MSFSLIISATLCALSMSGPNHSDILTDQDYAQELSDENAGPALSSAIDEKPHWESFNTWQCFSTQTIQLECTALDYGKIGVPTLKVRDQNHLYDFSLDPDPNLSCEEVLPKWSAILDRQISFCVYSAYLQELPAESYAHEGVTRWSLWIVDQIKSNGYWRYRSDDYSDPESQSAEESDSN